MRGKLFAILSALSLCAAAFGLESVTAEFFEKPKNVEKTLKLEKQPDGAFRLTISASEFSKDVSRINIYSDAFEASKGDEGYFIAPTVYRGSIGYFKYDKGANSFPTCMPFYGIKTPSGTYMAIVKGLWMEYYLSIDVKDGKYKIFPTFRIKQINFPPYEDIVIDFYKLEGKDADYVGMAKKYRQYQLDRGEVVPLKERVKNNPTLKYSVESPFIRIKMANNKAPEGVKIKGSHDPMWDKVTPDLNIMHTFDGVADIAKQIRDLGVEQADICFVGWNTGGFDGPFPDLFPVEERLGGETKMREAVKSIQSLGFHTTTHINNNNIYKRAKRWSDGDVCKNVKGEPQKYTMLPGGQAYRTCYQIVCDKWMDSDIAHLKDIGMNAPQHVDVTTALGPPVCTDPKHPNSREQMRQYQIKLAKKYRENFGGFTSEAGNDHIAGVTDGVLYFSAVTMTGKSDAYKKKDNLLEYTTTPIWPIVYHGIILSNPEWNTIDCYFKPKGHDMRLMFIEYGGRPTFYWTNYKRDLSPIKEAYDDYVKMRRLQYEFMDEHRELSKGVMLTGYSDGSEVVTNYSKEPFVYKGETVSARDFKLFPPAAKKQ